MPMDENEKKELVKKILEQRKALLRGEDVGNQKSNESSKDEIVEIESNSDTPIRDIPVEITEFDTDDFDDSDPNGRRQRKAKFSLVDELRKTGELGFKVIFTVIGILLVALLFGITIGYIITLNFSENL